MTYQNKVSPSSKQAKLSQPRRKRPKDYELFIRSKGIQFRYNEMTQQIELIRSIGGEIIVQQMTDLEEYSLMADLQDHHYTSVETFRRTAYRMARNNKYHPIIDYLNSIPTWDGKDYIGNLTKGYFVNPDGMLPIFFRRWMIGGVRRITTGYSIGRGTQQRMLVLSGPQNVGKSTFSAWLVPEQLGEYYVEAPVNPDQKDDKLKLAYTWIWEASELGAITRKADAEALKAFLTYETIRERPPYGKYTIKMPAAASFVGTVNEAGGFFYDPTGYRRFMVAEIDFINFDYTKDFHPDQLWAQAQALYQMGEPADLLPDEARKAEEINELKARENVAEGIILKNYTITIDPDDYIPSSTIMDLVAGELKVSVPSVRQMTAEALTDLGVKRKKMRVPLMSGGQTTNPVWVYYGIRQ